MHTNPDLHYVGAMWKLSIEVCACLCAAGNSCGVVGWCSRYKSCVKITATTSLVYNVSSRTTRTIAQRNLSRKTKSKTTTTTKTLQLP